MLLDYLPIVLFAAAYYLRDIYFATLVLIAALLLQAAVMWAMSGKPPKMQLAVAGLAVVFGGLTLVLRDPTFIKVKPTVLYGLFALVLVGSQYIGERPLMQRILSANLALPDLVWRRLNAMWAGFFLFCGVLNLVVAYRFSEQTWVNFKLFGMLALTFVFVLGQGLYLARHLKPEQQPGNT